MFFDDPDDVKIIKVQLQVDDSGIGINEEDI